MDATGNKGSGASWPSALLVTGQMGTMLYLLLTGPILPRDAMSGSLFGGGLLLVAWSVATMGPRRVKVAPEPGVEAELVTTGPYRWIRHPMYAASILISASWLYGACSWVRGCVWLALVGILLLKLRHEERMLRDRFPAYADYARRTRRLVPFIF